MVRYFIDRQFDLSPLDRWGNTPLDDARRHNRDDVAELLAAETE